MTRSQLALEDVEALYLGPSFLMADPMGPLLDQDEEALSPSSSLEVKVPASPSLSLSSYELSQSPYKSLSSSPPPSPPPSSFLVNKAGVDSLPWLGASDLLDTHIGGDDGKDDAFAGMDWMSEKIDLREFDLDSLIGSCSSDDSSSCPEDLLASLDPHMDLELDSFCTTVPASNESVELVLSLSSNPVLSVELPHSEASLAKETAEASGDDVVMKCERLSPAPSPSPPSPADTVEIGSEEDIQESEKMSTSVTATNIPDGNIQTTGPTSTPGHLVVVVSNKEEPSLVSPPEPAIKSPPSSDSDDDSGFESASGSPCHLSSSSPPPSTGSSRTKPYSKPEPTSTSFQLVKVPKVKSVSGAPKVVEKKLKKMEQNKTAATRYRQKKRVEQEMLSEECEELEKRNNELAEKAESISREIQYLKDLMEEVRKHHRSKTSPVA